VTGPVPWSVVFGNERPVEVEIGPGRGDVILAFASGSPGTNFFGIERTGGAAAAIAARAAQHGLTNVRVVAGDARYIVAHLIPAGSVAAYHLYFPDPWPKTRHRKRRLASEPFVRALARTLTRGGTVDVASDMRGVVDGFVAHLVRAGLVPEPPPTAPGSRPITAFERKYAGGGTHHARLAVPREWEGTGGSGSRC
jgi:tRNA (guanine-N7-)-methyltransferase